MLRRAVLTAFAALALAAVASACPFCGAQGQTLAGEVSQADFIVLGVMKNPKQDPADFTFHLVFLVASALGIYLKSEIYHRVNAPVVSAVFVVYIGLLFSSLQ